MQKEVTALGANPILKRAILVDENVQVLASTRIADIGSPLRKVLRREYGEVNLLEEKDWNIIKSSLAGKIEELNDDRTLSAVYPVILEVRTQEVRPIRVGSLIVLAGIAYIEARAFNTVSYQAFKVFFMLAVFSALMVVLFHVQVSRRIRRLENKEDDTLEAFEEIERAEEKEKIFQPLYSNKVKGIGLGLPIAKRYAKLNERELDAEIEEGKRSTFGLMLPTTIG